MKFSNILLLSSAVPLTMASANAMGGNVYNFGLERREEIGNNTQSPSQSDPPPDSSTIIDPPIDPTDPTDTTITNPTTTSSSRFTTKTTTNTKTTTDDDIHDSTPNPNPVTATSNKPVTASVVDDKGSTIVTTITPSGDVVSELVVVTSVAPDGNTQTYTSIYTGRLSAPTGLGGADNSDNQASLLEGSAAGNFIYNPIVACVGAGAIAIVGLF